MVGVVDGPGTPPAERAVAGPASSPNLLFIMTDDQRWDSMGVMPKTRERFNVRFTNAFATTPICCPSRASFLTGRYAHHTKVRTNRDYERFIPQESNSLGPWLQAQGYYTGFVGKYLNRYRADHPVPPGWDEFYAGVKDADGQGIGNGYTSLALREFLAGGPSPRNEVVTYPNQDHPSIYSTDLFADIADGFLRRASDPVFNATGKPWALLVWVNAPHLPPQPAAKYASAPIPSFRRSPSFMEKKWGDKPPEVRKIRQAKKKGSFHRSMRAAQLRMLMSVDDLVEKVFSTMEEVNVLGETWGLFASDNGYFWGEHRLRQKLFAYEEAARIPFRMAVPGSGPRTISAMVANIDVAPTFMELAGDTGTHGFDGVSLVPLIDGSVTSVRKALLIQGWRPPRGPHYGAVRTSRWKYIRWKKSGHRELYDLRKDPYELRNLAGKRGKVVSKLNRKLKALRAA